MGTTLYQNLIAIMFVYLFFAGSFSSFAQPNERPDDQLWDYPYGYDFLPPPTALQPPNAKEGARANPSPPPANMLIDYSPENIPPSLPPPPPPPPDLSNLKPPPPPDLSNLKPPPPDIRSTTDEWVSSNKRELNLGKKVGFAFLAVAVVLQIVLGGFLMYKRRKIANL